MAVHPLIVQVLFFWGKFIDAKPRIILVNLLYANLVVNNLEKCAYSSA